MDGEGDRRMKRSSGIVFGCLTHAFAVSLKPSWCHHYSKRELRTESEEVLDSIPQSEIRLGYNLPSPSFRFMSLESKLWSGFQSDNESYGCSTWLYWWRLNETRGS